MGNYAIYRERVTCENKKVWIENLMQIKIEIKIKIETT